MGNLIVHDIIFGLQIFHGVVKHRFLLRVLDKIKIALMLDRSHYPLILNECSKALPLISSWVNLLFWRSHSFSFFLSKNIIFPLGLECGIFPAAVSLYR